MLKPLEEWYCDTCGQVIDSHDNGILVFKTLPVGYSDFKIVHKGKCDNKQDYDGSYEIAWVLGQDGLTQLLSFLTIGPIKIANGQPDVMSITPQAMANFVDTIRRFQIPCYEEARKNFSNPDVLSDFDDANEVFPYKKQELLRIIRDY